MMRARQENIANGPIISATKQVRPQSEAAWGAHGFVTDVTNQFALYAQEGPLEPNTRIVGGLSRIPVLIQQLGADSNLVLAESKLCLEDLAQSTNRLGYQKVMVLFNEAARQTRCPHFGLLAGQAWHISDMGLVGQLMYNSPCVGDALQNLVLFHHHNSNGAAAFVLKNDAFVDLGFTFYVPLQQTTLQFYDGVMAAATNFMRELCGEEWAPSEVMFPHATPLDLAPFRRHFRAPLRFDSAICVLRFPSKYLNRKIVDAREDSYQLAFQRLTDADQVHLVDMVSRTLRTLLLHGLASGNQVAQSLRLHRRTLDRYLKRDGTSFRQIVDRVRFTIANELLRSSNVAIEDIAVALGYADIVSFFRAFKRWTGMTPGEWRQSTN